MKELVTFRFADSVKVTEGLNSYERCRGYDFCCTYNIIWLFFSNYVLFTVVFLIVGLLVS